MPLLRSPNVFILPLAFFFWVKGIIAGYAQIVPDTTLPNNTVINVNADVIEITGGSTVGDNLFHSFERFSIETGSGAFFANNLAIENIIARVTGGSLSTIDGLIRANGNANVFLLNPSGILFGPNASLDIGGSFLGSTANSIRFADGAEFNAIAPDAAPLLTVSAPIGLRYGAKPGTIVIQGPGNNLFLNSEEDPSVNRVARPPGLQVRPGHTLALVGGDIALQGGNLTASGGRIALGSVGEAGIVALNAADSGFTLTYPTINRFQDIRLSQAASLEASGDSGGAIQLQGRRVTLTEESAILADTLGAGSGGRLSIRATEAVEISDFSFPPSGPPFTSRISTDVAPNATGNGGNLEIETTRLYIANGAQISSGAFGDGNAGELRIEVQDVEIIGSSPIGGSGLFTPTETIATGEGGNLTVVADRVRLMNGAQIAASTFGAGNAGDLTIQANVIELSGTDPEGFPSGFFANVEQGAIGKGGNLTVNADRIRLMDGAQIGASTFGAGAAGSLRVQARELEAIGGDLRGSSALFAVSRASGQGGNLTIAADRIRLVDGGQIATSTSGAGDAGELVVRASESIDLIGGAAQGRSGLFATAVAEDGDGGDVRVITEQLNLREGATISVSNFSSRNPAIPPGQGAAGNLTVEADSILLDNGILTAEAEAGARGNINLRAETIVLRRNSAITTNARNQATGGNIEIDARFLIAQGNSDITANAEQSAGGRVTITALTALGIEAQERLTSGSDITASSALGPQFNGVVELNSPEVDPSQGLAELPSTLIDAQTQVVAACGNATGNEFVVTGRGGAPEMPTQGLRAEEVWEDLRLLMSLGDRELPQELPRSRRTRRGSQAGADPLTGLPASSGPPPPIVEAQGWTRGPNGQIALVARSTPSPLDQFQATSCAAFVE